MRAAKRVRKTKEESSAAEVIASNDDLLTELLLRLPVKSLLKFKSVCKHWLSLVTDPHFIRGKSLKSTAVPALLSMPTRYMRTHQLLPLDTSDRGGAALKYLNFQDCPPDVNLLRACNGLWLCGGLFRSHYEYIVFNPSTKQFKILPPSGAKSLVDINLAFEPSISQSYKVVCIQSGGKSFHTGCQILIYSSETGHWRVSGDPFNAPHTIQFQSGGAYWNGAIHWSSWISTSLYFDANEELLREMAMPPSQPTHLPHIGEYGGHLHLMYFPEDLSTQVTVYEIERDRSGWLVKFVVDFNWLVQLDPPRYAQPRPYLISTYQGSPFLLLGVVRGEKEEDSFLVIQSTDNDELIRYNFTSKTHEKICKELIPYNFTSKTPHEKIRRMKRSGLLKWRCRIFQYIDHLSLT